MTYIPEGYYVDVKDWDEEGVAKLAEDTAKGHGCDVGCLIVENTGGKEYEGDYRYMVVDANYSTDSVAVWVTNLAQIEEESYMELKL